MPPGLVGHPRVGKRVFKAPREFTRLRELSRIHMNLVGDAVRVQSRIKGLYRSRGVLVAGVDVYSPRRREAWQKQLSSSAQTRAARLYTHLDFLLDQKKHRIVRIVETPPGLGPIRAARLVPMSIGGSGCVSRATSDKR